MYTNQSKTLSGQYIVVWNNEKKITLGPEQLYGTIFCPANFYYANTLEEVLGFIESNQLLLTKDIPDTY